MSKLFEPFYFCFKKYSPLAAHVKTDPGGFLATEDVSGLGEFEFLHSNGPFRALISRQEPDKVLTFGRTLLVAEGSAYDRGFFLTLYEKIDIGEILGEEEEEMTQHRSKRVRY